MNTLNVPYQSQVAPGSTQYRNDCGAASVLMVLQAYNLASGMTVDDVYRGINPALTDVALSAAQMSSYMRRNGLQCEWKGGLKLTDVFNYLSDEKPLIALIHYAEIVKEGLSQFKGFLGAHFVVLTGIDIAMVVMQDPYRNDGKENVFIPHDTWMKAWSDTTLDGNPQYCALVPTVPIRDLSLPSHPYSVYELVVNGINVRSGPGSAYPIMRIAWKSVTPKVTIVEIAGEYGRMPDGGWVYVGSNPVLLKKSA